MRVLCVVAHPDDEVLWCWPALQDVQYDRAVLAVCDNKQTYGENSLNAFYGLGKVMGWETCCLHKPSEFYRLPYRRSSYNLPDAVASVRADIKNKIDVWRPDIIMTHNPFGEYGHGDHRLTAELVYSSGFEGPIWITDICIKNKCHVSYEAIPAYLKGSFYSRLVKVEKLNLVFFKTAAQIYQNQNAWSWHDSVAAQCGVYEVAI